MNSAGRTGAKPIITISRPWSMSSWVMVSEPHRTKKHSSGLVPGNAP